MFRKIETVFPKMGGCVCPKTISQTMSYASAVKSVKSKPIKPKPYTMTSKESAYAFKCNAQWGDIASYDPKEDGSYEEFFRESGLQRRAVVKELTYEVTSDEVEADLKRIQEIVAKKEQRREQAKQQAEEPPQCKCGCGRAIHLNPSPEFIGYCCKWCKKHNGRRGHGEACGK